MKLYLCLLFSFFHGLSFGQPPLNEPFDPRTSVFVIDVPIPQSTEFKRVCFAQFLNKEGTTLTRITAPNELSECSDVRNYRETAAAYNVPAALEGSKGQFFARESEAKVSIAGREWQVVMNRVIFARVGEDQKRHGIYNHVCTIQLLPTNRVKDPNSPRMTAFCKALSPIRFQARDMHGRLMYLENGQPDILDSMVCPLPEKCLSKEFAIQPTLEIKPETDDDLTPHATRSRATRNH